MSKVPIAEVTVGHPPVRAQSCPHVAKRDVLPVADFSRCACEPSRSALLSLRTCTAAWEMIEEGGTAESAPHLRADEASISHELWKRTSGLYARRVVGRRWYTEATSKAFASRSSRISSSTSGLSQLQKSPADDRRGGGRRWPRPLTGEDQPKLRAARRALLTQSGLRGSVRQHPLLTPNRRQLSRRSCSEQM